MAFELEYNAVSDAKTRLAKAVSEAFPSGSAVHWERGGHQQHGTVIRNAQDRLFVRNDRTRRELWIHAYDLTH